MIPGRSINLLIAATLGLTNDPTWIDPSRRTVKSGPCAHGSAHPSLPSAFGIR